MVVLHKFYSLSAVLLLNLKETLRPVGGMKVQQDLEEEQQAWNIYLSLYEYCKSLENLVATGALLLRNTETVLVSCIENNAILYTNKSTETIQRKKNTILYNHNLMSCY